MGKLKLVGRKWAVARQNMGDGRGLSPQGIIECSGISVAEGVGKLVLINTVKCHGQWSVAPLLVYKGIIRIFYLI